MATTLERKKRELEVLVYTMIAFVVILIPLIFFTSLPFVFSFCLGYLVCLANILFSVSSIRWGFRKKSATFYKVVWGGMLMRLVLFSVVFIALRKFTSLPVSGFLISFVLFYLYLQYQEIRLVNETLNKAEK
jgi:hypothetical protein